MLELLAELGNEPILQHATDRRFAGVLRLLCGVLDVPHALVARVEDGRIVVLASTSGFAGNITRSGTVFARPLVHGEVASADRRNHERQFRCESKLTGSANSQGFHAICIAPKRFRSAYWLCGFASTDADLGSGQQSRFHDLADLVQAELMNVEESTLRFFEQAPIGVWVVDTKSKVRYANEQIAQMLGWEAEEMIGTPISKHFPPDIMAIALGSYTEARLNRTFFTPNSEHLHRNGARIPCSIMGALLTDAKGIVTGAMGLIANFGQQVNAPVMRFEQFAKHSPDIMVVFDANMRVRYISPAADKFGWLKGDLTSIFDAIHPDDREMARHELSRVYEQPNERHRTLTLRAVTKAGELRYLEARAVDLRHEPEVAGVLVNTRDVTDRVLQSNSLAHAARHDYLTKLPNRGYAIEQLTGALARSQRGSHPVLLCFLDLDGFKEVNDDYGHAAGDEVLISSAQRLQACVRPGDIASRFGGDEFVVVCESIHEQVDAEEFAARLSASMRIPHDTSGGPIFCSVTIGFALSVADDSPKSLLGRADAHLYERKRARNP